MILEFLSYEIEDFLIIDKFIQMKKETGDQNVLTNSISYDLWRFILISLVILTYNIYIINTLIKKNFEWAGYLIPSVIYLGQLILINIDAFQKRNSEFLPIYLVLLSNKSIEITMTIFFVYLYLLLLKVIPWNTFFVNIFLFLCLYWISLNTKESVRQKLLTNK